MKKVKVGLFCGLVLVSLSLNANEKTFVPMEQILLTKLRDKNTSLTEFRAASDKLGILLAGSAARFLGANKKTIETPLEETVGYELNYKVTLAPILRSGFALLIPFLKFFEGARIATILLQRNEETAEAMHFYDKVSEIASDEKVILLDPMLATGGSATFALRILKERGAREENIICAFVVAVPEGIAKVKREFPGVTIVTPQVDRELNDVKFILPGLGDYGDRYFGT